MHAVVHPGDPIPPANPMFHVNSEAASDGSGEDDIHPQLSLETGNVLHCIWESNFNFTFVPNVETGSDYDIFHSANATGGNGWSPFDVVNTTAWDDHDLSTSDIDSNPVIAFAPNGLLVAAWETTNDLYLVWIAAASAWRRRSFSRWKRLTRTMSR